MATKIGRHISVCTCVYSNLVIYLQISKFHIWTTFIKLLFISEYGFCLMNDNQDCRQSGYPLSIAGHYTGPLSKSDCSSFYFLYRAAEEKRHQEEEQRMVVAGKRVPTVSVQPMREGNLAPWQRELQGNN